MELPADFIVQTREVMGEELFGRYLKSFEEQVPVSIRLNPKKCSCYGVAHHAAYEPVRWCDEGFYLPARPNFTFDPLFHAGVYYVQEASSMFLSHVVHRLLASRLIPDDGRVLDLCAAPGGKSTLLRSVIPEGCTLVSNEPVRTRAQVLAENVQKWGYARHIVTNNYPRDFRAAGLKYDMIVCDVPCSGEGMFRKDEATISEWSLKNVEKCWQLQREIVTDAWACLRDGGILVYSTCTFNTKENEENIRWMMQELGAEVLKVPTDDDWGITGSLLPGFCVPVYRFIPGVSRGEGLFMCVLRKGHTDTPSDDHHTTSVKKKRKAALNVLADGNYPLPTTKGRDLIPAPAEALYTELDHKKYPTAELNYPQAIAYLRREAITLEVGLPRGFVVVTFMGVPLGFVKNIGNRANNHYPDNWKIKTTHIPQDYEAILRHT